ncbi:MAG: Trp biosynthesis-associated membrane protein [Nocardioides sp.]
MSKATYRSLGVVATVGLASGLAAAVAGNRAWVSVEAAEAGDAAFAVALAAASDASAPPVTAFALVLLATWGVVLVTRGRFRRVVAWLGLLAAAGVLVFGIAAWIIAPDAVTDDLASLQVSTSHTAWSYIGVLAGVGAVVSSVLAVRSVGRWAEMGRRYDAPGAPVAAAHAPVEEQSSLDLWKALDEGRDPTEQPPH